MADVQKITIEPGTLLVLRNIELEANQQEALLKSLQRVTGHEKFIILYAYGDDAVVTKHNVGEVLAMIEALNDQEATADGDQGRTG